MSLADEILGGSSSKQTNKSNNKNNNKNNSNKKKNNQTKISDEIFSGNYSAPKQTTTVQQKQSAPKQTVKLTGNKFLDNAIKNANNTERNEATKQQIQALANRWNSNLDKKTLLQQVGNYVTSGDALDDATNLAKKGAMFATNKNYRNQVIKKGLNSAAVAIPQLAKGVIKTGENWYDTLQTADFLVNEGAARKLGITSEEDYQKKKQKLENKVKDDWTGNLWKYGLGWDEDVDKFLEQNSYITGSNTAGQLVESVGQQLPAMAIGQKGMDYMLGGNAANSAFQSLKGLRGAERAKAVGTNLTRAAAINSASNAEIFARSYGAAAEEALQQGASIEQASKYGVLKSLAEIGTEWVTSGIPGVEESTGLLSNGASKLLDKATGKIKKEPLRRIVRNILDFTGGMAGEGFEEALSEVISPYIKNATYTQGEKVNLNDVVTSFLTGAVSSGLLDFGGNVANRFTRRNANIQNNELAQQQVQQIQEQVQNGEITPQEGTQQINDIQNYLRAQEAQTEQTQEQPITPQETTQTAPTINETTQDNINTQEQQNVAQNVNNEVVRNENVIEQKKEKSNAEKTFKSIKSKEDMDNLISNLKNTFKEIYDIYKVYNKSNDIYEVVEKDGLYGTKFESEFYNPDIKYKPLNEEIKIQKDNLESWLNHMQNDTDKIVYDNQDKVTPTIGKKINSLDEVTPITTDEFQSKLKDYINKETEDIKGKFESDNGHLYRDGKEIKYLYRAIDQAEMDSIKKNGYIKSNQSKNIGYEIEQGLTDFKDSYPGFYLPRNADGYIIKIETKPENGFFYDSDEYAKTPNQIPASQIVEINGEKINNLKTNVENTQQQDNISKQSEAFNLGKQKQTNIEQQPTQTNVETQTQQTNIPETKTEPVVKVDLTGEKGKEYFMENGANEKVAQILSEKPKQKSNKLETAKEAAGQTYRLVVSKGGEIEKISKITNRPDVKYKYDKSMRAMSEAQQHIGVEQTDLNYKPYKNFTNANGEKVSMSLNDIRKDAKNNNISEQTLNEYLAHNLNVDRYMEDKPVFGKSVTSDDSLKIIAEIEQEHPEIKRIAQNVWTYEHNELKNAYDSGLISKELYDKLAKNEHYVRIQRNVDKKSSNAAILGRDGKVSVNQGIQTAKGGNQDILPIMEGIAKYTTEMVKNERINESVKSLAESMSMGSQDDTIQSIEDEESFGFNPEIFKANDDGTYTMTFFNKGKATVVPINKAIYDAYVTNKNVSAAENALPTRFLTYLPKKASSMFRTLTTDKNPMFMVTNFFKDIGDAPFNSKYAKEFAKEFATTNAHRQVVTNGGYNKLYNRAGGDSDSYFTEGEFKDKTQSKIGKAKDKLLFPIEKGNQIIEAGPRMAEFIATIKANGYEVNSDGEMILKDSKKANGRTAESVLDEALYNAAEITTNFKRGGDLAKAINRNGGTFFNASIQGFDKQVRNFKDAFTSGDKKKIIALLAKALIFGVAPTMLNDAMNDDDEEYKNMQDYLKDNYYLFKTGDGNYVRIPKGRAMSVIGSAYRRTKDLAGGEKDAFKGFTKFASGQVAPNNPFENNIIAPLFAVGKNESWAGNPIVSQTLEEGRPTEERYTEKTDELSKWLGKQLKNAPIPERYKTPAGINYLIDQYTGGAGDVLLPMITPKATSKTSNPLIQPFISKFTTDSVYQQKDVNKFYDVKAKLKQQKGASYATKEDKVKSSYMESRGKELSALYAEQHEIQNDKSLSKKEKYEKAREVQKKINKFANESVKNVNDIKDHKYYATIGDDTYYLTIDKKTGKDIWSKDSYADSHKKTADKKGMALYDYYKEKYEERKAKEK